MEKESWENNFTLKEVYYYIKLAKIRIYSFKFFFFKFYYQKHTEAKLEFIFLSVKRIKFSWTIGLLLKRDCEMFYLFHL